MKTLRIILAAACLMAGPAIAEPTLADLKAECGLVSDAAGESKPGWAHKDLSKAQCLREIRSKLATIRKNPRMNISTPFVACWLYCEKLYGPSSLR